MAGGHMKYRQLSRDSAHRKALLRNLVTSLIKNESIHTTWPKAKEAQRLAEKLITHAKKNDEVARRKAQGILFVSTSAPSPNISPSTHLNHPLTHHLNPHPH
jgi:ribosomal protein L17